MHNTFLIPLIGIVCHQGTYETVPCVRVAPTKGPDKFWMLGEFPSNIYIYKYTRQWTL